MDHDLISIYVFGFQEIVPLNTGSIVSADETNMRAWSAVLEKSLNERRKTSKLILCGSVQLVGLAILVFIRADEIDEFRSFQIMKSKTAGMGFAGNKGALVARFE